MRTIRDILFKGKNIEIRGFGTFLSKKRKPKPARNPKTGEVVPLEARYVPLFKFSADLKRRVKINAPKSFEETQTPADESGQTAPQPPQA